MARDLGFVCSSGHSAARPTPSRRPRRGRYACAPVSISTKRGDGGTTGLFFGGRVRKDSGRIEAVGAIDEAQATLGMARAEVRGGELDEELQGLERGLWIVMAEVATLPDNRGKLVAGETLVTSDMVERLEARVHDVEASRAMPSEFVVPGNDRVSAALDMARAIVRRAERAAVSLELEEGSQVVPFLNRLSDLCWLLARTSEQEHLPARADRGRALDPEERNKK